MKTYYSIIFDLDDTLWDTVQNSKDALHDIFNIYELNRFYEKFEDFHLIFLTLNESLWNEYNYGKITKDELQSIRFRKLLSKYTLELDFQKMNDDFIETTCTKSKIIEGAHEVLQYLSKKYPLCILSNSFEKALIAKTTGANFTQYFQKIYSSEVIKINKPDPNAFSYIINDLGWDKNTSIMIGDNLTTDIGGAKNSDIDQVWFNREAIEINHDFQPTYIISSLFDLKKIL